MSEPSGTPAWHWRYGIHPNVDGLRVRSLGRVELGLGEALRIEMLDADPGSRGVVHLQYYILTDAGPWALWLTCASDERADQEAALRELAPPSAS